MDFVCAMKRQKNSPEKSRAIEEIRMDKLSHESKAGRKVIAKACAWADRRKSMKVATHDQIAREAGRYRVSINELAEAVEHYRKQAGE